MIAADRAGGNDLHDAAASHVLTKDESASQQEVIAFLSDPKSHRARGPIECIETHAAIIFLVGRRALKLKRAVRFPYLDFSSAAKRKAVCEAEVALNLRTAPDLYLGVRHVGRLANGRLAINRGTPVDWLIVMRRFGQDALLAEMAKQGPLDPRLLRDLADAIARFHDCAEIVEGRDAEMVRRVIEGNRLSIAEAAGTIFAPAEGARLAAEQLALLDKLAPLLNRRADAGMVRLCHGDLHLANICLWRGRPTLFDCLEFDRELATSDVLYDLAFLLMDLWHRGLHGDASHIFNRYCDRRAEAGGVAALPLFLSMRAAVRAHVEASSAARAAKAEGQARMAERARSLLTAAFHFLARPAPRLIAVGGISGSGKSTLAAGLAPLIAGAPGARLLRTDMLRKRLAGVEPEAHIARRAYTRAAHEATYAALVREARETLDAGWPVVVDAVFDFPDTRTQIERLAAELAVPFCGVWLEAPPEMLRARVRARRNDASDAGTSVVDRQLARDIGDLGNWCRVDASGDAQQTLRRAAALLGLPPA